MKTLLKLLAWLLGTVVVLAVAAVIIVPRVLDPNAHKGRIAALVKEETGRALRIEGNIGVSVFPWLGVSTGKVALGNAPGFAGATFASADSMQVRVKLLPLLHREVRMDTVRIDGLALHLERDRQGRTNWQDLEQAAAAPGKGVAQGTGSAGAASPPALAALAIGGLDVGNSSVTWDDARSGQSYRFSRVALKTGPVDPGKPVDLSLSFHVDGGTAGIAGDVSAKGAVTVAPDGGSLNATGLKVDAELTGPALPGGSAHLALAGDAAVDLARQLLDVKGMKLAVGGLGVAGGKADVSVSGHLTGKLDTRVFDLGNASVKGTLAGGRLAAGSASFEGGAGAVRLDLARGLLALADTHLAASGLALAGGHATLRLAADLGGNIEQRSYVLKKLSLTGTLSASHYGKEVGITGTAPAASVRLGTHAVAASDLALGLTGLKVAGGSGELHARGDLAGNMDDGSYRLTGLAFKGTLAGSPYGRKLALEGGTTSTHVDIPGQAVTLAGLRLDARGLRVPGPGGASAGGELALAGDVTADLRHGTYRAKGLRADGKLAGDLVGGKLDFAFATDVNTNAATRVVDLKGFGIKGSVAGPRVPGGRMPFDIAANIAADLAHQTLALDRLHARAGGMGVSGELHVARLFSGATYKGRLALAHVNPRALMKMFGQKPPDTADPRALTALEGSTGVSGSLDGVTFDPLSLKLDASHIKGRVAVAGFAKPAWRFDVDVDALDADRYLPPRKPGREPVAATPGAAAGAAAALPVATLRALNAAGRLHVGHLQIANLKLSNVLLTVKAEGGQLQANPLHAGLYGGSYDGNLNLDARGKAPHLSVDEHVQSVQVGSLLRDLSGRSRVAGIADAELKATATGHDTAQLERSLDGNVSFRLRDAAVEGVDVAATMCRVMAGASRLAGGLGGGGGWKGLAAGALGALSAAQSQTSAGVTRLSDIRGSGVLKNGVLSNRDLQGVSPQLEVRGGGRVDFPAGRLDYEVWANLARPCQGQHNVTLADLRSVPIAVRVSGPLASPSVAPDEGSLLRALANSRVRNSFSQQQPATGATQTAPRINPKQQILQGILKGLFQ